MVSYRNASINPKWTCPAKLAHWELVQSFTPTYSDQSPCNSPYCLGSCNYFGPGTCDGPCEQGRLIDSTSHACSVLRYKYIGCYADNNPRDLSGSEWKDNQMTLSACYQFCFEEGFKYAGTQAGNYCFCGNSYGSFGTSKGCSHMCAGDTSAICGGIWANSVFDISCDVNCASSDGCTVYGLGKCDVQCKVGWSLSMQQTCKSCPADYKFLKEGDSCYKAISSRVTYAYAYSGCDSINTGAVTYDVHLAFIETQQENEAVFSFAGPYLYIGGCRVTTARRDAFVWTNRCIDQVGPLNGARTENFTFTTWFPGDPANVVGEYCLAFWGDSAWADVSCPTALGYLCEIEV